MRTQSALDRPPRLLVSVQCRTSLSFPSPTRIVVVSGTQTSIFDGNHTTFRNGTFELSLELKGFWSETQVTCNVAGIANKTVVLRVPSKVPRSISFQIVTNDTVVVEWDTDTLTTPDVDPLVGFVVFVTDRIPSVVGVTANHTITGLVPGQSLNVTVFTLSSVLSTVFRKTTVEFGGENVNLFFFLSVQCISAKVPAGPELVIVHDHLGDVSAAVGRGTAKHETPVAFVTDNCDSEVFVFTGEKGDSEVSLPLSSGNFTLKLCVDNPIGRGRCEIRDLVILPKRESESSTSVCPGP